MKSGITAESGLQLLARLHKRPSLLHLDDILFPEGPEPGDLIQISGQSSVGKSLLLLKFLTKALLPKSYDGVDIGGLEAGVILINTDHSISILKLVSLMENFIKNAYSQVNKEDKIQDPNKMEQLILESLKRLIVLETYSSLQLEMNFYSLERILSGNTNMSLIVIDSMTAYYWGDRSNEKSIKKMDLYLKIWIEKLKKCVDDFKMVIVFVIQDYFQSKQSKSSSSLIKHKIHLKKEDELENFTAHIFSQKIVYNYKLSEKGFVWVVYSGCGYKNRFEELSESIKSVFPDVEVNSVCGRTGSFEIKINDVLVYSKLRRLAFPDYDGVVEVIEEVQKGMPPREVNKQQSYASSCAVL